MKGLPFKSITTKKIQKKPASALLAQLSKHYPLCYNHIHFRVHREQCTIFQHKYAVDEQDMTFNHTLHFFFVFAFFFLPFSSIFCSHVFFICKGN